MTQDELLKMISANPGIEQTGLKHGRQIRQLLKKKEIIRISIPAKHGTTFRLYPVES